MARLLVTVGMGSFPFNRLVAAAAPLCAYHDVFVQTGTSPVTPPCPHAPSVPFAEMRERLAEADIVITHAGRGTIRLVQRLGGVPVVVARRRALGESRSSHQESFLRSAEQTGRLRAVWDVASLPAVVASHGETAARLAASRPLPPVLAPEEMIAALDEIAVRLRGGPLP
jgi:UDP-N-acetylglucosamine transferase subunit ALG13